MGTTNLGLFTSTTDEWPTPNDLFEELDREFGFDLDPCADELNAKCARYFTKNDDGLSQEWRGKVFMNPPYGRQMRFWIEKAWSSSLGGATVVCLIPARTDTSYWHDFVMRATEIRFISKRLHFASTRHSDRVLSGEATAHNAPFPSVVVVFTPEGNDGHPRVSAITRSGRSLTLNREKEG